MMLKMQLWNKLHFENIFKKVILNSGHVFLSKINFFKNIKNVNVHKFLTGSVQATLICLFF